MKERKREEDVKLLLSSRNVNANEAGPTGFGLTIQEAPKFWIRVIYGDLHAP